MKVSTIYSFPTCKCWNSALCYPGAPYFQVLTLHSLSRSFYTCSLFPSTDTPFTLTQFLYCAIWFTPSLNKLQINTLYIFFSLWYFLFHINVLSLLSYILLPLRFIFLCFFTVSSSSSSLSCTSSVILFFIRNFLFSHLVFSLLLFLPLLFIHLLCHFSSLLCLFLLFHFPNLHIYVSTVRAASITNDFFLRIAMCKTLDVICRLCFDAVKTVWYLEVSDVLLNLRAGTLHQVISTFSPFKIQIYFRTGFIYFVKYATRHITK
jgi:hypothetical protein